MTVYCSCSRLPSLCSHTRFVSEQMQRMSVGDDETEAGRRALWVLRNKGVDIRVKQVCETHDT